MTAKSECLAGIIEGFYGRPWSWETRLAYVGILKELGLNSYVYCPKSDPFLRKQWQQKWPPQQWRHLQGLSGEYRKQGLNFGVGLSPFALYQNYDRHQREQLKRKIFSLNDLQAPLFALLFDDMPGALDDLASRQAEIVADVVEWTSANRIFVCPTYYSLDPILEQYFGRRPPDYWLQLGRDLPASAEILWTGNQVCSGSVTVEDVRAISDLLGRPVALWDNYPVNDGAVRSNFLYTSKLSSREVGLPRELTAHLCNPMNQGLVSLLALLGLTDLHKRAEPTTAYLYRALGKDVYNQLQRDSQDFENLGLSGMGQQRCSSLAEDYAGMPGPAAAEVAGWLRGEYTFDPACLTD